MKKITALFLALLLAFAPISFAAVRMGDGTKTIASAGTALALVSTSTLATTLTHTYGVFSIPAFLYTTTNVDDSLSIFANVSAALSAGSVDATAIGTSIVAIRLY